MVVNTEDTPGRDCRRDCSQASRLFLGARFGKVPEEEDGVYKSCTPPGKTTSKGSRCTQVEDVRTA